MRSVILLLITVLMSCGMQSQPKGPRIAELSWLSGCWEATYRNGVTITEQWMKPLGGTMMAMSRTVVGEETKQFEFVRIVESADGTVTYIADPSGQSMASFVMIESDANRVVFENPTHDFPQRIIYERISADSLVASIEGTKNGKLGGSSFPYRRSSCE